MQKKLLLFFIAVVILFSGILYFQNTDSNSSTDLSTTTLENSSETFEITQVINFGNDVPPESSTVQAQQGKTALELLQSSKNVEVKEFDFGTLVESIDGYKNGTENKYWSYYVNGKEANVGASEYQVQANDEIRWEFKAYEE